MIKELLDENISWQQLLAFLGMIIGIFMAILDIQIVASSISVIGAGLSASLDELSWVQTSYMIAEVMVIPLTGFLSKLLSTRIAYSIAAVGFTFFSVMCAFAWNIESMIVFRAFQGFFGGAMIPTVFSVIYMVFPKKFHARLSIITGLVVTLAPTLGPVIGGYITDLLSWQFMFLVNIIPGLFVVFVVYKFGHFDNANYSLIKSFDYLGVFLICLTLGCLQFVLEEGNKKDWFESNLIILLTFVVIVGFAILIYNEVTHENPILDLSAFKNYNFVNGCLFSIVIGIGLFGSVFLTPIFLANAAGMNTFQIGVVMTVMGASQFLSAPVAGSLFDMGVDRRLILGIGLILFGYGTYINSHLTVDSRFWEFFWPQFIRGFSLMFCFIPTNELALGTIAKDKVQDASGIYNLMRNLGGAIGLAIINKNISNDIIKNKHIILENIPQTSQYHQEYYINIKYFLSSFFHSDSVESLRIIDNIAASQSFVIAINNAFTSISIIFFISLFLLFFTKNTSDSDVQNSH